MSDKIASALLRFGLTQIDSVRDYVRSRNRIRDQDVDDVLQEVFRRLLQIDRNVEVTNPIALIRIIADRAVDEYQRKRIPDSRAHGDAAAIDLALESPSGRLEDELIVQWDLERVLQALPPIEAAVLALRYAEDLSLQETAKKLGLSPASVKRYEAKARSRIAGADAILPVAVFLQDGAHADEVMRALEAFLETFDLVVERRVPPVFGSFFGRFWVKAVDRQTTEELKKKLQKVEQALETQQIAKPQSEVDLNHAQAAAALMNAIGKESKSVAIQVGNLLCLILVDEHGHKHARVLTLTAQQCSMIQENQDLLCQPEIILKRISESNTRTGT